MVVLVTTDAECFTGNNEHFDLSDVCIYFNQILNIRPLDFEELAGDNFEFL